MPWNADTDTEGRVVRERQKGDLPDKANFTPGKHLIKIVSEPKFALVHWFDSVKRRAVCPKTTAQEGETVQCLTCDKGLSPQLRYFAYIINRATGKIELWEFSRTVKEQIASMAEAFGDPKDYDVTLTRQGTKKDTKWFTTPANKGAVTELTEEEKTAVSGAPDLDRIYKVTDMAKVAYYLRGELPPENQKTQGSAPPRQVLAKSEPTPAPVPEISSDDQPF